MSLFAEFNEELRLLSAVRLGKFSFSVFTIISLSNFCFLMIGSPISPVWKSDVVSLKPNSYCDTWSLYRHLNLYYLGDSSFIAMSFFESAMLNLLNMSGEG